MVLRKSFYIRWSAGRSPRVHEVNPGRDPSGKLYIKFKILKYHNFEKLTKKLHNIAQHILISKFQIV